MLDSSAIGANGMGSFFRHVVELLDEKNCFPLAREGFLHRKPDPILGELPSSKDRVSIGLFRYTWLCLKIKGASHLSGSPF